MIPPGRRTVTSASDSGASTLLSAEEALSVLGDETRLGILRTLGEADEPLSFSDLYARSECDTSANFSYHLGQLTDYFVHETDGGYVLRQAGRRVIEAVLAEAPGEEAGLERTRVDRPCFLCDAPVEVSYRGQHVGVYCPACNGTRNETSPTADGRVVEVTDVLGYLDLPPAGVTSRTPAEVLQAATFWTTSEALALARNVCPRCSAPTEQSLTVCEDHDADGSYCEACGQRFAVTIHQHCTNCIYSVQSPLGRYFFGNTELVQFMIDHGIDPLAVDGLHLSALEETVVTIDPFEARFEFTVEGDALTLAVDDDLSVTDVTRDDASESSS